jgi:Ser-tRNA(Ala) deacylase AlaX
MVPTQLLYLEDFTSLINQATVTDILQENGKAIILLDKTIFYPQGGGQPYDKGTIENSSGKFLVDEVRFVEGIAKHIGHFEHGEFKKEDIVTCTVNKERRELHSRLHSGGHVVDMAVNALKFNWIPGKGYHFPDGPYVEYTGIMASEDKDKIKNDIEHLSNKFINEGSTTKLLFMDKEKMKEVCRFVPDYLPANKPSRVVMYGDFGVPCGGTHVSNLADIGTITIRKLRTEGQTIRVSYEISQQKT